MRLARVVRPKLPRLTLGCAKISGLRPTVNGETPVRSSKARRADFTSAQREAQARQTGFEVPDDEPDTDS